MPKRTFQPGFRLSVVDILILVGGAIASGYAMNVDRWVGLAIGFVVLHFFLFCNVLRMSRMLELIWAGVFVVLAAGAISFGVPGWPIVFAVALVVTVAVAIIEARRRSYHGVGWRRINPGLPEWWRTAAADASER